MKYASYGVSSERLGGLHRAESAVRDPFGRFQPKKGTLNPPAEHGKIGGQARARKARRDGRGRFA
jgi:hypothetical protein